MLPCVNGEAKPIAWLHGEIKTPPFSAAARVEAGILLRRLQRGERLSMPHSRPMPAIGARCHELRINDEDVTWRILYRVDPDAIVIAEVTEKKTQSTPKATIETCKGRLYRYDRDKEDPTR
jgi:phage-related protein